MNSLYKVRPTQRLGMIVVWLILVLSTIGSSLWVKGMINIPQSVVAVIIALAALKVTLVIAYYMEINNAPTWLKAICGLWVVCVFGIIFICHTNISMI